MGKCVVLGITGGIAAYKVAEVVSRLGKAGVDVYCIMTRHAGRMFLPLLRLQPIYWPKWLMESPTICYRLR